ncbi:MAG TPA: dihydrolipoamide acetyltransferase family protein [Gemmataceae bacterium]|nr:dihydrolipoamide acetyltransferase family protein [Gemmataceae bacterium]
MDFALPEIGEGVYEAELTAWLVKPGDVVKRGQNLMEIMTDKAAMEVPAPFNGTIASLHAEPGQKIKVGEVVLRYSAPQAAVNRPAVAETPAAAVRPMAPVLTNGPASAVQSRVPVKAAPSVRQMARQLGVDLGSVHGTGPEGRILIEDLAPRIHPAAETPQRAPDYGKPGTRIKFQGLRRKIAEHLTHATRVIPHYAYVDECEVTDLVRLRDDLKAVYAKAGVKLTYLAFIVKAVAHALKEVPLVNASLDESANEIVLHDHYNVGIAVATPAGLVVPVIHDADKRDLGGVAREIERLSNDARAGKQRLEDLRGGTFSVTSLGNIGGLFSAPIINHPEVGILGVGRIYKRPVFDDHGRVRPSDRIYLSLSFDHRVVDGAVGGAFANAIIAWLQNPALLLLPEKL